MNYFAEMMKSQRARKSLSILNVFGLSVSIAAALLLFLYVSFELSYDSFHDGDRVFRVESRLYEGETLTDNWATTAFGHAPVMSREIPGIEKYVRLTAQDREQVVTYQDRQFTEEHYCYAEPSFFEIFNFPIVRGEQAGQLVRPNTAVITESAAHRYFGGGEPLGKILTFRTASAEQNFEVTGVIADMPANSHIRYDFLLSYSTIPKERQDIWYIHGVYTYVRLRPGVSAANVEKGFRAISDKYKTTALKHKDWAVELIPLKDIHLTPQKSYEKEAKGNRSAVYILAGMAVALLFIGWVNALNLTVARFLERGKEFGVRKSFGASRKQMVLLGLTEAGVVNLLAALLAWGWLEVALPVVSRLAGQDFIGDVLWSFDFMGWIFVVVVAGTLFSGLYPSLLLNTVRPSEVMRGKLLHSRKGNSIRKALIVVQFVASFVLISGTFIVVCQVRYMQAETASVSGDRILVIKYPSFTEELSAKMEAFKKRLKQKSYVRQVSVSGAVPGVEVANYFTNRPYGSDPSQVKLVQMFAVDHDYLKTYKLDVVAGRGFSEEFGDELNRVVLNEEAVRLLGYASNEAALGKQLKMEVLDEPLQIIGVVKNYYQQSLATSYKPILFFMKERVPIIGTPYISIGLEGKFFPRYLEEIRQMYLDFFPNSLFSYFFSDELQDFLYRADRNFGWIFASAALLAVFVACLGLWVVTLFSTLSRVKEVAIRKVLGAGKKHLFTLLTRELLVLSLLASVVGIPVAAFFMENWLNGYAFHIFIPVWVYGVAFLLLLLVAFLTVIGQVWRILHLRPMSVLRNE